MINLFDRFIEGRRVHGTSSFMEYFGLVDGLVNNLLYVVQEGDEVVTYKIIRCVESIIRSGNFKVAQQDCPNFYFVVCFSKDDADLLEKKVKVFQHLIVGFRKMTTIQLKRPNKDKAYPVIDATTLERYLLTLVT